LRYNVVVGPGATNGSHENRAKLRMAAGQVPLTQDAIAAVEIVPDGTFDLGTIRAKIFCDDNKNQWQEPGELGLPGVRMVVDTGQWTDSDIDGKAHFSAIPAGMHVVKIDDTTLPPGTTLDHIRETFYMSTGMPAEVEFYAHCAFVKNDKPQISINEDAYRPDEVPAKKHHIEGKASPAKLVVDGAEVALPQVVLGLSIDGVDGSMSEDGAGPNLPSVVDGALKPKLVLAPKIESAPDAPVAWQIVIEALGLPAPLASDVAAKDATVAIDPLAKPRAIWVFAGQGAPPPSIGFDGKDPASGSEVLFEHQLYRATLSVGFDDGARASSSARVFGVRAGIVDGDATSASIDVDSEDGELFNAMARPTPKLNAWLGEHAAELKGKKITIVVHSDAPNTDVLTDKVALIVKKALVAGYGFDGANITTKGAGDAKPKVPNLRKKDRAKNRRVEILVEKHEEKIPPLAPPLAIAPAVSLNGAALAGEDGSFASDVQLADGTALSMTFTSPSGAQAKVVRSDEAAASSTSASAANIEVQPMPIVWRPAEHRLLVNDKEIAVPLLDVKLAAKQGALLPSSPGEVSSWSVRVLNAKPDAPVVADDSAIGPVAREISGDGKLPSEIPFDGLDSNGVKIDHPRARLIVKLANGDTGTSPDLDLNAAPSAGSANVETLKDPLDDKGALKPDAVAKLKELAASAKGAQSVRVEVHSDDAGPRLERRTKTQDAAEVMKLVLVKEGVPADRITALGMGSDVPVLPNIDRKSRAKNRRAEITITQAESASSTVANVEPALFANGNAIASKDGSLAGAATPSAAGDIALDLKDANGARALLHVKPNALIAGSADAGAVWQGDLNAFESWVANVAPLELAPATSSAAPASTSSAVGPASSPVARELGAASDSNGAVVTTPSAATAASSSSAGEASSSLAVPASSPVTKAPGAAPESNTAVAAASGTAAKTTVGGVNVESLTPAKPPPQPPPAWEPDAKTLPANNLVVDLPADITKLKSDTLLVRGHTSPENRVRIGAEDVPVDEAGNFVTVAKLPEGDSQLVIEATDAFGNTGTIKRDVNVDTTGWFTLLLADTAFGGDGADLGERTPYTSLKLGDTFVYGRGAAFVHGRWHGATLFQNYDLVLDVDTRRWQDDIFDPELIDPERFFPVYGDSATENVDATRSAFPIYLNLRADSSSLMVGAVRTELNDGSLFRYTRARSGAQLTFDRGWSTPIDVDPKTPPPAPDADPWRTRVTAFVAGGGGQQHTRVEMMGTGSSVYFLKDQLIVEGSEQVNLIVRDAVTGAEIARTAQVRDVDYTIRYDEGRIMFKEPISAFADGEFTVNQNLGQVANANRVFVEVEYEHQDDQTFSGVSAGGDVKQIVLGHAEVGGGYVYEGREGITAYQLGGGHLRLFADQNTWIQAELLGSESVDAANFISTDGGLTYQSLGQSLNQKDVHVGQAVFPAERQGIAFKLEGNAQLGQWLGRKENSDANVHAYVAEIQPGFFADSSIVEQGETKWGTEGAWQVFDDAKFKLRYDGVIAEVPDVAPEGGFGTPDSGIYRTLHREIAVAHYEQKLVPSLTGIVEYGFGYTWDSGSFGPSAFAQSRDFVTNDVAAGVEWQVIEPLTLGLKQEYLITGDPQLIHGPLDQLITHLDAKYALTESVSLLGGTDFRWSGENQVHAGVSWAVNDQSRVYVAERVGMLPAPVTGTLGWGATTVVGGEEDLTPGSTAYAEYQLDGGFAGEQSRGVVGLKTVWKLPFGFALNFGYERIMLIGSNIPTTEAGNVPPGAFTDGTFYQAPGANGGGSYVAGQGSRDAVSAALEFHRGETIVASQRLELRYDNQDESRGGHDLLWMLSGTAAAVRFSPEVSVLGRYNIALAQDLTLSARDAYFEEGALGVAYRPITHDWFSLLAKISRRVDERPLSLEDGTSDNYTAHAISIEPIVETPWKVQLVEKLALKHSSEKLSDVPDADSVTGLWINRVNLHTLAMLHSLGVDTPIPGEIDLGVEYRLLDTFTTGALQMGPEVEVQVAPVEYFRIGVGYNFTHFSDDELDSGKLDRSGFFVRAVGTF
jgi:outer membrane protein OmpA-like peptidoglycan-associated protein